MRARSYLGRLFFLSSILVMLSMFFSCNLLTGPHNGEQPDTTSHNWTFEIFDFGGDAGSSVFRDAVVFNDSTAYAVGEIPTAETGTSDSLGNPIFPYNVGMWNGKNWSLRTLTFNCRLYYPNCGPDTNLFSPGMSIFAFGQADVWVASGSVHNFDGQS